jgi:hypothetical protein
VGRRRSGVEFIVVSQKLNHSNPSKRFNITMEL